MNKRFYTEQIVKPIVIIEQPIIEEVVIAEEPIIEEVKVIPTINKIFVKKKNKK
jgi:hypothetical protein